MSYQATFNRVVRHARKQGKKAVGVPEGHINKICLYRAPGGLRCFAGALIADRRYDEDMEGQNVSDSTVRAALRAGGHDPAFVKDLQHVHDNLMVRQWEKAFRDIARDHELTIPEKE